MADDVALPGVGAVIATDDIGSGRQVQLVKPAFGADGTATTVSATNPLPVAPQNLILTAAGTSATTIIGPQDVTGYTSWSYVASGTFSASHIVEGSINGSTWDSMSYLSFGTPGFSSPFQSAIPSNGGNGGQVTFSGLTGAYKFMRVRLSSYSSGTVNVTLVLSPVVNGTVPVYLAGGQVTTSSSGTSPADASSHSLWASIAALQMSYNGSSFDRQRHPRVFKSVTATASGDTAVWTPAASRRFQLLKFQVFATAHAAQSVAGTITVTLRDATTSTGLAVPVYVPGTGGTALGGWTSGWIDIGPYGYRSTALNAVLNVNLSAALTAGAIGVVACGVEET